MGGYGSGTGGQEEDTMTMTNNICVIIWKGISWKGCYLSACYNVSQHVCL